MAFHTVMIYDISYGYDIWHFTWLWTSCIICDNSCQSLYLSYEMMEKIFLICYLFRRHTFIKWKHFFSLFPFHSKGHYSKRHRHVFPICQPVHVLQQKKIKIKWNLCGNASCTVNGKRILQSDSTVVVLVARGALSESRPSLSCL